VIDFLRAGRILRLIRLLRIVRALASAAFTSILLLLFSSKVILQAVQEPGSNIKTAEEAIW
jgi:voltage-gated potassium channel